MQDSFDTTQEKFEKAYTRALKFLNFRPRSEKEVRDNLLKKKIDPDFIEGIIELLKKQKFLNDYEFTRMWVESRLRSSPRSLSLIKRELLQKGVSRDIVEAQISNFQFSISNELDNAKRLVEKKIKRYKMLEKHEIYQKLGAILARRGFDWDTIRQSIDEVIAKEV